jgi:hypothetical protein
MLPQAAYAGSKHLTPAGPQTLTASAPLVINISTNTFGNFTVTCSSVTASFTIPTTGLTFPLTPVGGQPIQFNNCNDTFGGTDTITTSGTWNVVFKVKPGPTYKLKMNIPLSGLSLSRSFDPSCLLTVDTSTTSKLKLSYDDVNTATIAAGANPGPVTRGAGCPGGLTASMTFNSDTLVAGPGFQYVA